MGMRMFRQTACCAALILMGIPGGRGQDVVPEEAAFQTARLTLGTPMVRSAVARLGGDREWFGKWPDLRLKVESEADWLRSPLEMENRLRGLEIRWANSPVWIGYEVPTEGSEPRATFSIQRGF